MTRDPSPSSESAKGNLPVWHQIPVEIAIQIFRLTLPEEKSEYYYYHYYSDVSRLRLVCKGWQDIVESNATFWPFATTSTPPGRLQRILECAKDGGGIEVRHDGVRRGLFGQYPDTSISVISRSSDLWTSLFLSNDAFDQCHQVLANPAQNLKTLHVTNMELGRETDFNLFQNAVTQLETLTVQRSAFPWRSSIVSDLREIELYRPSSFLDFEESFTQVLRASPRLASLAIRYCDAVLPPHTLTTPVHLSQLRTLEIESSPQLSSQLLLAVVCTPATIVTVMEAVGSLAIHHPVVSAALSHALPDCKGNPSLAVEYGRALFIKYGNVGLKLTRRDVNFEKPAQLAFCSAFFGHFTDASRAASSELQLEWSLGWDITSFLDMIDAHFPSISGFELICRTYSSWVADLSTFARALTSPYSKEGRSRWLLPRLETLSIRWTSTSSDWLDEVIDIVRSRSGAPEEMTEVGALPSELTQPQRLRCLCLHDCTIPSTKMNVLKDLLGSGVELDGVWIVNNAENEQDYGGISIAVS